MRVFLTLWRREFGAYFLSPVGYIVTSVFLFVAGLNFWKMAVQEPGAPMTLSLMLFGPLFFWVMVLVVVTAVTMRLFAEEKRTGTLEMLLTAPLSDRTVVMAKFWAAWTVLVVACLPSVAMVLFLRFLVPDVGTVDWGPIAGGYLVLVLSGAFYVSVGLFVSSLVKSQVLAAVLCFAVLCVLFFVEYFGYAFGAGPMRDALTYVSASQHILEYASGLVDTRPAVLYLTGAGWMLFATTRALESRRWK